MPIHPLRNISLNPNLGGEVMVVSLGSEKLQSERLLPPGSIPWLRLRAFRLRYRCNRWDALRWGQRWRLAPVLPCTFSPRCSD